MDFNELPDLEEKFLLGQCVGCGVFGKVFQSTDSQDENKKVAVKILSRSKTNEKAIQEEYRILKDFSNHPNLPIFFGAYKSETEIWFVMELCEGGPVINFVNALLKKNRHMSEEHIAHILKETVKALMHLHSASIIHRNIKASNILLTKEGEVKLCDFGLSKQLEDTEARTGTCIGSPCWMAPEVVVASNEQEEKQYDRRADVWALGITAIELGDGRAPYQDAHPTRALFQVVRNPPPTLCMPSRWSGEYNDFVSECLVKNLEHRPYIEELIEHPFLNQIPDNNFHLATELKSIINDLSLTPDCNGTKEELVHDQFLKQGFDMPLEEMQVEDLAALNEINEDTVMKELIARALKGEYSTYVGDVLLVLNTKEQQQIYGPKFHNRYCGTSRSENAPHIYAVAESAYQAAIHHEMPQKVVLAGESGSGKTRHWVHIIDHLLHIGDSANIGTERIRNALHLLGCLVSAAMPHNPYSTRCVMKAVLNFGKTGKVTAAEFRVQLLEKLRVSSVEMSQANFYAFYYIFDGLKSRGELGKYFLDEETDYRYLRIPEEDNGTHPAKDTKLNIEHFRRMKKTLTEYEFLTDQTDAIFSTIAAILILGNIRFKDDEEYAEIENYECVEMVSQLLNINEKKLGWALTNYCLKEKNNIVKKKNTVPEAREARDVLANNLYARIVDYIFGTINQKLAVGRTIFGDKHEISVFDYFGFECVNENRLPQLYVNIFNEQLQFHYTQSIFEWESLELKENELEFEKIKFHKNQVALDEMMDKSKGILSYVDQASMMGVNGKCIIEFIEKQNRKYVVAKDPSRFAIAHYTGTVTYNAKEMPERNRDYLSPEIIDTMRLSENSITKLLFTKKLSKLGNMIVNNDEAERCNNDSSTQQYSQMRKMRTLASIFKSVSLEYLKELSVGAGYGGTHFVRCVRTNLRENIKEVNEELLRQQLRALAVVETAKIRQQGYPYRISFPEFLRRYKFLAFEFEENVEVSKENCRLLLIRLKMEGWAIGKTKVFLTYYNEEYLSRLCETQVNKIIKIQSILRGFLTKCRMKKKNENEGAAKPARRGSDLTEDDAARIIQKAYRFNKRRGSEVFTKESLQPLNEEEKSKIYDYAKKWRSKSLFQILLYYRSKTYHDFFNFSQQVHFFNQCVFHHLTDLRNYQVDMNNVDTNANAASWLGDKKPSLLKSYFRLEDIPFYDTSDMRKSLFNKNLDHKNTEIEEWDAPYRRRKLYSVESFDKFSNDAMLEDTQVNDDEIENVLIHTPYTRNPENTTNAMNNRPASKKQTDSMSRKKQKAPTPAKIHSKSNSSSVGVKFSAINEDKDINSHSSPANNDFDFIKPSKLSKPKVDPIAELKTFARNSSMSDDDDPPFNFRGMLRKTNFQRESMKNTVELINRVSLKRKDDNSKFSNNNRMAGNTNVYGGRKKNSELKPGEVKMELMPGIFITGLEADL